MKNRIMVILMAAALALPAIGQWNAQNNASTPQTGFQSTSTMQGSGSSYSSNPSLNSDGTASSPASGPRRAKMDGEPVIDLPDIPAVEVEPKPEAQVPVGDVVLPLMLMAAAGAGIIALRRRKAAVK